MENQDQKQKTNKYDFRYTAVPFRLLRAYDLLDKNDRDLMIQILSWGDKTGCFVSVDNFTEVIMKCGEHAFYRSLYKLKMLGLVRYRRGTFHRSSQYWFEFNPLKWRLTRELMLQIKEDLKGFGIFDPVFQYEPFPNTYGFYHVFNIAYPDYAVKIKQAETQSLADLLADDIQMNSAKWAKRFAKLDAGGVPTERIIFDYFNYRGDIETMTTGSDTTPIEQQDYLRLLKSKFDDLRCSELSKSHSDLINEGERLLLEGNGAMTVASMLEKKWRGSDDGVT